MAQPGQPTTGPKKEFNWGKLMFTIFFLALIAVLLAWMFGAFNSHPNYKSLKDFENDIKNHASSIKRITLSAEGHIISVDLKSGSDYLVHAPYAYISQIAKGMAGSNDVLPNSIADFLSKAPLKNLIYDSGPLSSGTPLWQNLLISFLPTILLIGLIFWSMKRMSGGSSDMLGGTGKSPAKRIVSKKRFIDVAGQAEAKEEVSEVVDFLKNPSKYKAAGARIPKGILLGGPPGTGKTLLAKAVAGESGVPFFFISASNFVEMFAGLGAKRVREMFKEARKTAPAILFIDELDAIGRKRGSSLSGNDEREQTLNQILVEMDGMEEAKGLLIIAATNRPDVLDKALLRPGRFDRTITVNLPDIKERQMILELHAKGKRISPEIDFANIAKRTPRYSGADLESVVNEATILSVREKTGIITIEQIDEAIDRVQAGPAKKHRVITPRENKMVAIHEAGHAVIGLKVENADIVQKITIIPRGDAGGYTLMTPKEELYNYSKSQLDAKIIGLLGGRAAEQVVYGIGEVSTGASNDIERATAIARAMVTQYGMSDLGPIAYERDMGSQFLNPSAERAREYSDALAERIDEAIRKLILSAEKKAIAIVKKNLKLLNLIVEELIEKETIVLEEINYINKNLKRPPKKVKKDNKSTKNKTLREIIDETKNEIQDNKLAKTTTTKKPKTTKSKNTNTKDSKSSKK